MARWLALAVFSCTLCPPVFAQAVPAGPHLRLSAGFGFGEYNTDLERRYQDDLYRSAATEPVATSGNTGVGYGAPWKRTGQAGLALGIEYRAAVWFAGYDAAALAAVPTYRGVLQTRNAGITTTTYEDGRLESTARARGTFYGGIPLAFSPAFTLDILAGLRFLTIHTQYDSTQYTSAVSGTGARTDTVGITLESKSESRAAGLMLGAGIHWKLLEAWELRAGLHLYDLAGDWILDRMNAHFSAASSVFSGTAQLIHEDGRYRVRGAQLSIGGYYTVMPDLQLFAALTFENSAVTYSGLNRYDTSKLYSPPRLTGDHALYTGSSTYRESIGTIRLGVEKRYAF